MEYPRQVDNVGAGIGKYFNNLLVGIHGVAAGNFDDIRISRFTIFIDDLKAVPCVGIDNSGKIVSEIIFFACINFADVAE